MHPEWGCIKSVSEVRPSASETPDSSGVRIVDNCWPNGRIPPSPGPQSNVCQGDAALQKAFPEIPLVAALKRPHETIPAYRCYAVRTNGRPAGICAGLSGASHRYLSTDGSFWANDLAGHMPPGGAICRRSRMVVAGNSLGMSPVGLLHPTASGWTCSRPCVDERRPAKSRQLLRGPVPQERLLGLSGLSEDVRDPEQAARGHVGPNCRSMCSLRQFAIT